VLGILGDPVHGRARIAAAKVTGERLDDGGYGYKRAFTYSPTTKEIDRILRLARLRAEFGEVPVIVDPFAGGGAIPFEAARYGCEAVANELNPVAGAILRATVDLPFTLGPDFGSVIHFWGERWTKSVGERLGAFFPVATGDASVAAYIWAHTVPCPATGKPTPLAPDFWLARGSAGRDVAVRLEPDGATGTIKHEIVEGKGAAEWGNRSTYKSGTGTSIWTGQTFDSDYIVDRAKAGEMGGMLLAVSIMVPGRTGRQFRVPSQVDLDAVEAARLEVERSLSRWEIDDVIPTETRFIGPADRSARYGILTARQMFTPRQLLTAATAVQELRSVVAEARIEIGEDKARAIGLYLALAVDKSVDYNGMLSSWHATRTTVRNVFDRHDFSFKWSFAEFDGAHALLPWALNQVVDAYRGIAELTRRPAELGSKSTGSSAVVTLGSSIALDQPTGSVSHVITDPPYFDNVMYGECADYFLVWLRRSLRDTWPEFCQLALSDKDAEAVANSALYTAVAPPTKGKRKPGEKTAAQLADEHYEKLLTLSFGEAHRILRDDGVMTVMFTHKRVDAWDSLGQALLESGFSINSSWPVHTESEQSLHQAKKNAASSTILLTCRKRGTTEPAYWSDIRGGVVTAAREAAENFSSMGMHGIDLTLSTFGPVLSVLSRNWPVYSGNLDAEGNPEILRPDVALDLARAEVARLKKRGLLGGRDVEFDRITDWYLLAWSDFEAVEFPSGEALKLSLATHLELEDLVKTHKVIRATSGTVTILSPAQRRTAKAFDPQMLSWPTMLDALHAFMLTYEEDGAGAARAWLERTGHVGDSRFRDLVLAAVHAIPRVRQGEEFVRPEARALEGIRITLFDDIPAPAEPIASTVVVQRMFGDEPDVD